MNTGKIKVRILAIVLTIFPFSLLYPGPQYCLYSHETSVPRILSESFSFAGNWGSSVNLKVDSGLNWKNITIEISRCVYGVTTISNLKFLGPINTEKIQAVNNKFSQFGRSTGFHGSIPAVPSRLLPENLNYAVSDVSRLLTEPQTIPVKGRNCERGDPVLTVNFMIRVTGTITFHVENIGGKNLVTVTRGKTINRSYDLNVDGTEISRSTYCYKSATDKHKLTGIVESNAGAG